MRTPSSNGQRGSFGGGVLTGSHDELVASAVKGSRLRAPGDVPGRMEQAAQGGVARPQPDQAENQAHDRVPGQLDKAATVAERAYASNTLWSATPVGAATQEGHASAPLR